MFTLRTLLLEWGLDAAIVWGVTWLMLKWHERSYEPLIPPPQRCRAFLLLGGILLILFALLTGVIGPILGLAFMVFAGIGWMLNLLCRLIAVWVVVGLWLNAWVPSKHWEWTDQLVKSIVIWSLGLWLGVRLIEQVVRMFV
jgi:hypothetical protein